MQIDEHTRMIDHQLRLDNVIITDGTKQVSKTITYSYDAVNWDSDVFYITLIVYLNNVSY